MISCVPMREMYFDVDFTQILYQYNNENPTFLPSQVRNTCFIKHIFKIGCGHRNCFCWHGYFSYLVSRRAEICLVAGGKSEIKADFHLFLTKYNCIIK